YLNPNAFRKAISHSERTETLRSGYEVYKSLGVYPRCMALCKHVAAVLSHLGETRGVGEESPPMSLNVCDLMVRAYKGHHILGKTCVPGLWSDQAGQGVVPDPQLASRGLSHGRIT